MVIHLKNRCNLDVATQGQIIGTLLCPSSAQITFVWNIFSENASLKKYFGVTFKMGYHVYLNTFLYKKFFSENKKIELFSSKA